MIEKLTHDALVEALAALPLWRHDEGRRALYRRVTLGDFAQALAVMVEVGLAADKADHHPEWANVYNRIDIWLTTHDADGISDRDVSLARVIDAVAARHGA